MINEVKPMVKVSDEQQSEITEKSNEQVTELSEDMEMVSPGAMLRDARELLSLSQEHIASKLNFKVGLVKDIEEDNFDPSMPVTFNRGYLANYAKLVGVDVVDVLASYDALDAATIQRSEMLSFSKETLKQAEHSRVMWLSYIIVAVLIGLTVLWWQQESSQQAASNATDALVIKSQGKSEPVEQNSDLSPSDEKQALANLNAESVEKTNKSALVLQSEPEQTTPDSQVTAIPANADVINNQSEVTPAQELETSTAVFTFSGDCWVNIYDATGERIAWGVKKSGYVMTIQGKAPLRITVGKPELTSIVFNGQVVDMSPFNVGNIAKFNLPIIAE